MIRLLVTPLTLLFCLQIASQNLVPNPSFEDTVNLPNGRFNYIGWENNLGSPDYFSPYLDSPFEAFRPPNNLRGYEYAYEGVAYFGFVVFYQGVADDKEYMQTELLDTLIAGRKYEVEFYLSLADSFHWALAPEDIQVAFRKNLLPDDSGNALRRLSPAYASDTAWNATNKAGWEKFHYTYTALGGEKTIVIGCFKDNSQNTITNVGNGGNSVFYLKGSYYFIDKISVQAKDTTIGLKENTLKTQIKLYPNPAKERFYVAYSGSKPLNHFRLYNLSGKLVSFERRRTNDLHEFAIGHLPVGMYLLEVENTAGQKASFRLLKIQ
ncbi:MAG: hypothetical protein CMC96_05415 [Flavobacteriales bacterium]|nr:hypothetical protein [Flavobacteriales bacterium]